MSETIDIEAEGLTQKDIKLKRRSSVKEIVNETMEKSWRSVKTGLGKVLETKVMNILVITLLIIDVGVVVAHLLIKLYKREYPQHLESLQKADDITYWIIFGLRLFYAFMVIVRVCSFGMIYLADPLNLFDAFIVIIAAVFFLVFNERDRIIACFFILCRFWRINRVLESTEQKRNDRHAENYRALQLNMTSKLEGERNINDKLRKELEQNDHNLDILMGDDLITNKDQLKSKKNGKGVKFDDNAKDDGSMEFNYIKDFEHYFHF